jgi:hypothetical protein
MILFHGTNAEFETDLQGKSVVSLEFAKERRDFGRGFYTTTIREQAEEWAEIICRRYKTRKAYLYEFDFSQAGLTKKTFDSMTEDWLDFIIENRIKGGIQHTFDIVIGPVANDKTVNTLNLYLERELTLEETLNRLKYMRANNQISIHTARALDNLVFIRKVEWEL